MYSGFAAQVFQKVKGQLQRAVMRCCRHAAVCRAVGLRGEHIDRFADQNAHAQHSVISAVRRFGQRAPEPLYTGLPVKPCVDVRAADAGGGVHGHEFLEPVAVLQ